MKAFRIATALFLLTVPAGAQTINLLNEKTPRTADEIAKDKAVEDAYKAKINKIPEQKAASDPWATMRAPPQQGAPPARRPNSN
ncbi:MAG TPA: hypothetical protein VM867_06805 [Xanthobacteraceae bacterium]|jgi:hypothetical protein|nr:hypothetical protein [Xanthobacteraceae bacterium]